LLEICRRSTEVSL